MRRWAAFLSGTGYLVAVVLGFWSPPGAWVRPAIAFALMIALAVSVYDFVQVRRERGGGGEP